MRVTKECTVQFKGGGPTSYPLHIPAGLRVAPVKPYPMQQVGAQEFWIEEFPYNTFPQGSVTRHDAIHYGVWLGPNETEEREEFSCANCGLASDKLLEHCTRCGGE